MNVTIVITSNSLNNTRNFRTENWHIKRNGKLQNANVNKTGNYLN